MPFLLLTFGRITLTMFVQGAKAEILEQSIGDTSLVLPASLVWSDNLVPPSTNCRSQKGTKKERLERVKEQLNSTVDLQLGQLGQLEGVQGGLLLGSNVRVDDARSSVASSIQLFDKVRGIDHLVERRGDEIKERLARSKDLEGLGNGGNAAEGRAVVDGRDSDVFVDLACAIQVLDPVSGKNTTLGMTDNVDLSGIHLGQDTIDKGAQLLG